MNLFAQIALQCSRVSQENQGDGISMLFLRSCECNLQSKLNKIDAVIKHIYIYTYIYTYIYIYIYIAEMQKRKDRFSVTLRL